MDGSLLINGLPAMDVLLILVGYLGYYASIGAFFVIILVIYSAIKGFI